MFSSESSSLCACSSERTNCTSNNFFFFGWLVSVLAAFRGALAAETDAARVAFRWIFWGLRVCQAHGLGLYN